MRFEILKEDKETGARLGTLHVSGRKIETPILWPGCSIRKEPFLWKYFDVDAVMLNSLEVLEAGAGARKIHEYLGIEGFVMMDSGGFQLMEGEIRITPGRLLRLYEQTRPDIGVVLDHPFNPGDPKSRMEKWKKTLENTRFMLENSRGTAIMPVIHGYTPEEIKRACNEIKEIASPKIIGVGSLVPLLRRMKTSELSKLNGADAIKFIVNAISIIRKEFPDAFLHVFGVGSVATMHLMFSLGVDSVDSMSWRTKAAYGAIQLPGTGDRFITPENDRKRLEEDHLLENCRCPVCAGRSLEEKRRDLDNSRPGTFLNRAVHNAFVLKEEERKFREMLARDGLAEFVKNRLKKTRYQKFLKIISRKQTLSQFFN